MTEIFTAKTVEEAKELAVRHFGAAPEEITFEVLEEAKKGFFGIGKSEAKIRATYVPAEKPAPAPQEASAADKSIDVVVYESKPAETPVIEEETPAEAAEEAAEEIAEETVEEPAESVEEEIIAEPVADDEPIAQPEDIPAVVETVITEAVVTEEVAETEASAEEKPAQTEEDLDVSLITGEPSESALAKIEKAKNYLAGVLAGMGIEAQLTVTAGAESAMIDIEAPNNGAIIGKRGETLDALQYLTFMVANRGDKEYYRIILNSANYRERRRKTLKELAAKIAKNVLRTGRSTTLEPMNPYERRIIHSAIAEIEGVSSKSVGEEPYRKVVISSVNKPPRRRRNDRNDRNDRKGGNRGNRRNDRNDRNDRRRRNPDEPPTRINMDSMKTSFEMDYKRPKPEDDLGLNAGLYGKIEF